MYARRTPVVLVCMALVTACAGDPTDRPSPNRDKTTLRLEANASGDLAYCHEGGDCDRLPNPDGCAVLVVVVDNLSGESCERCEDSEGRVVYDRCQDTHVDCTVVTAPEPDCVVCAYIGGNIFYSSCVPSEPQNCEYGSRADDPSVACRICYDANGRVVLDECRDRCDGVVCPAIDCAEGYWPVRLPAECCAVCLPRDDCERVLCPMEPDLVDCPPGTALTRDPSDCCGYYCRPTECPPRPTTVGVDGRDSDDGFPSRCASDAECGERGLCVDGACLSAEAPCPPGFRPDYDFPACGACVPVDNTRYCRSNADCREAEYCAIEGGCAVPEQCRCFAECDEQGACREVCADCACLGVCRPRDWVCPELAMPSPEACEGGHWQSPGRDEHGCPLPPVCVCLDGSIAIGGRCRDACGEMMCPDVEIECRPGQHLEAGFPYCCGVCVPDDECWTFVDVCAFTLCERGFHCEVGPRCDPVCVPELRPCYGSRDCATDQICSTELGECAPPPDCRDASGSACITLCAGVCLPRQDVPVEPKMCMGRSECGDGFLCTTETGDCLTPPGCNDPGVACPAVCYGICEPLPAPEEPAQCEPEQCGPALGMPNWVCPDGQTFGGPTGRCLLHDNGECGWEVIDC